MLRESTTMVVERNTAWHGAFATEPCEAAWAAEAILFIRALAVQGTGTATARVQLSPDGMHWCDEGTTIALPAQADDVTFARVRHFGGWLRLVGETPAATAITVIVYLTLKA
ncbi:MAG: hypothetical protein ACTHMR_22910 [Thermomicrobiales bacterium]